MLKILAATTVGLLALCNECTAQSAKLEVVYAVLDADTAKAIADSPYLRDFSGKVQETMQGSDEGHYRGIYIFGRENYVELFGPADINLDGPRAAAGCAGLELNVERVGGLAQLKPRVQQNGLTVDIRTFHRDFKGRTVDWFKSLATPAQLSATNQCLTPTTEVSIEEYVPSYLEAPEANKPASQGPEDVVSRARYHHNDYTAQLVQAISGVKLAIRRKDWPAMKAMLAAADYRITETRTGAQAVGDVHVTLMFVSDQQTGLREVDFQLNSTPGTRHVQMLGHSRLVVGPTAQAVWSFEPRH